MQSTRDCRVEHLEQFFIGVKAIAGERALMSGWCIRLGCPRIWLVRFEEFRCPCHRYAVEHRLHEVWPYVAVAPSLRGFEQFHANRPGLDELPRRQRSDDPRVQLA